MAGRAVGQQLRKEERAKDGRRNQVEPFDQPSGQIAPGQKHQRDPAGQICHQTHTEDNPYHLRMDHLAPHFFNPSTVVAAIIEAKTMYELPGMIRERITATAPAMTAVRT